MRNRFTTRTGLDNSAIWSPNGERLAYQTDRGGSRAIVTRPASGVGDEQVLFESSQSMLPRDWSSDGAHIHDAPHVDPQLEAGRIIGEPIDMVTTFRPRR